ncbi:heparinase II/III family protein [Methylobacterium gossipiicola]|uniref:Heparinase II/III-like protein n=1 Tax=Methylobacterium gossipiicola TaxID=582675 RepID=A0A1I2S643_9HYPH|nr:heparinase II/III family protein [Methylobacterium gossipiicola]SFG45461.1 Heparinase II/III-like protein [Methylobacterium gossipiicola]
MSSFIRTLTTALRAISYVPPHALIGHARRRYRNKTVPLRAASYRAAIERVAVAFPEFAPSEPAHRAAAVVAVFQEAKQAKNVPDCLAGRFTFLNRTVDFGSAEQIDWTVRADAGNHQLWRWNLANFGYACTLMDRTPEEGLAFVAGLIPGFLRSADFSNGAVFSETWHPYAASQRTLALTAALVRAPAALRGTPDWTRVEAFLRYNVAFLLRNLETELGYNHLERNLSALALFGLSRARFPPAIAAALRRNFGPVVEASFGEDGGQLERSAMYQSLSVQSLRILREVPIWTEAQARLIDRRLGSVEAALAALTLGDDQPVMFNDAWIGEGPPTSAVLPGAPAVGFRAMPDCGYVRLACGPFVAVFDAGPIGVDMNPGHGHADFLAIETSVGPHRLIVDPGTYSYSAGPVRDAARAWGSHNGPSVAGMEPVEFLGSFKVGRRCAATLVEAGLAPDGRQSATGRLAFAGVTVERSVALTPDFVLEIADRWAGAGDAARTSRFLIPAGWRIIEGSTGEGRLVMVQDDLRVEIRALAGTLSTEAGRWSRRYNVWEEATALVLAPKAEADRAGLRIAVLKAGA